MDEEGGDRKQCIGVKDLEEEDFTGITTKFIIEERISYEGIGQIWKKNPQKNRYAIKCYDSNRVLLPSGVYINASHINALKAQDGSSTNFIATIGPKKNTARDFWEMVESLQVNSIIMLCRMVEEKKQKCYGYFPKVGTKVYGEYEVSVVDMNELIIKDGGDKETLKETHLTIKNLKTFHITSCKHFQFIDWPDHFVPKNYGSLLHLYKNVVRLAGKGHIVVHCSAGIGRTGVFIGAFMIFELYTKNKLESIESGLKRLREQRFSAVQTLDQYCFLHLLLIELILIYDPKVDKKQVRDLKKKYIQIVKQSVEESESGTAEKKDTTTEVRVPPPPKVAPIPKTTKPISDAKQTPTKKEQIQKPKNSKAKKT